MFFRHFISGRREREKRTLFTSYCLDRERDVMTNYPPLWNVLLQRKKERRNLDLTWHLIFME